MIGRALLAPLTAEFPAHEIVAVARDVSKIQRTESVTPLSVDLCQPSLGLAPDVLERLADRVEIVIHGAADTRFSRSCEESRAINVGGTNAVLAFAQRCRRLQRFLHMSTLYIAGKRWGNVPESELVHEEGYWNSYEQSKHEAEGLVMTSGLPWSICRLSSVIGSVREGAERSSYFHQLIRLIPQCRSIDLIPAHPEAPVDLIDADWAAQSLALLAGRHFEVGSIRHVCAGPERSLRSTELISLVFERLNRGDAVPSFGCLNAWHERLESWQQDAGLTGLVAVQLHQFLPHLGIPQPFETTRTRTLIPEPPDPRLLVERVLTA